MSDAPQDSHVEDNLPMVHASAREVQRVRVLVAQADVKARVRVASALRDDGYEVVELASGSELWDLLSQAALGNRLFDRTNVIVCDLRLPGCCGLDVLVGLKMANWAVPVILTSGQVDRDRYLTARWLGAVAIFDNPFDIDALRTAVMNVARPN